MLSGLKFIPRDQLDKAGDEDVDGSQRREKKRNRKDRSKKRSPRYDKDGVGKIKRNSRKKKWYSSDEDSTPASESGSESESDSDADEKSRKHRKNEKKSHRNNSKAKDKSRNKQSDDKEESSSLNKNNIVRKELGLDWMLRPKEEVDKKIATPIDQLVEPKAEEIKKENPRELNPYFKNRGTGYPEEADEGNKTPRDRIMSNAIFGDGGASWRLKALKRAQEQAAREGKNLNEVVEERWESVGQLSVSLASRRAAPSRAHLHAIKSRQKGVAEEQQTDIDGQVEKGSGGVSRNGRQQTDTNDKNGKSYEKESGGSSQYSASHRDSEAKLPKVQDSLSWGKRKGSTMSSESSKILSTAIKSINKFANDGSFMSEMTRQQTDGSVRSLSEDFESKIKKEMVSSEVKQPSESKEFEGLSANQLAAKALQLRLKGKNEEADKFMREVENIKAKQVAGDESSRQNENQSRRYTTHETPIRQRRSEDDGDVNLAQKIMQNKKYSTLTQADDEYDYEDGPRKKSRKKDANMNKSNEKASFPRRILTQQERCKFCFENPNRPKHLVLSIANLTYLSLPHWQSIVPGHCCILTLQHESATRALDNNVWDEIRNFKKCLIMMFAKQERDVVFLETVMGLAQQKRHCLVEVIPLPRAKASAAPLYFKKAIDEAEDEWSQHNAKKLIDTSQKGLRGSIPKDFPYFHVEFGLNKGFVHVIDDETSFKSNFGINVIRGMLQLPEEDMYGRTKPDSIESQKQAVASFAKDWEAFDWTKQLD